MKVKNALFTLGLTLTLGIGVGVGLAAKQNMKETKAATEETTLYIDWRNTNWSGWTDDYKNIKVKLWHDTEIDANSVWLWDYTGSDDDATNDMSTVTVQGVTYLSFSRAAHTTMTTGRVYAWDGNTNQNKSSNFTFAAASAGQNLLTLSGGNNSTGPSLSWGTLSVGTMRTVTLYGNYNGTVDTENPLGSSQVADGDNFEAPKPIYKHLVHFEGWYEDADCETAWTTRAITADTAIYAKYTPLTVDSYVYWVSESSTPVFDHASFWNEYVNGWPGEEIADYEVSGVMVFNGLSQKIYKIPVPSGAKISMALNNNNGKQTYDIDDVVAGSAYYTYLKTGETKYSYSENTDAAKALDLLLRAEEIRNAVRQTSGAPADYSICGVSASDAASLYNEYYGLTAGAKTMVDNTTTKTYDGKDTTKEVQVSYSAIMAQLKEIAVKGGQPVSGANRINVVNSDTMIYIIIVAFAAISAVGVFFAIKRRKHISK